MTTFRKLTALLLLLVCGGSYCYAQNDSTTISTDSSAIYIFNDTKTTCQLSINGHEMEDLEKDQCLIYITTTFQDITIIASLDGRGSKNITVSPEKNKTIFLAVKKDLFSFSIGSITVSRAQRFYIPNVEKYVFHGRNTLPQNQTDDGFTALQPAPGHGNLVLFNSTNRGFNVYLNHRYITSIDPKEALNYNFYSEGRVLVTLDLFGSGSGSIETVIDNIHDSSIFCVFDIFVNNNDIINEN